MSRILIETADIIRELTIEDVQNWQKESMAKDAAIAQLRADLLAAQEQLAEELNYRQCVDIEWAAECGRYKAQLAAITEQRAGLLEAAKYILATGALLPTEEKTLQRAIAAAQPKVIE